MITQAIQKTWNRVRHALAFGQITLVDDTGPVQTAQIQIGPERRSGTPIMQHFGFVSNPPPGTACVIHFAAGNRSAGIVSATGHILARKRNLLPGESAVHDDMGRWIYFTANGGIVIEANGTPVTIANATTITAQASIKMIVDAPLLECTGDILDNCNTQTETMAGQRAAWNAHTHDVRNVAGGEETITTTAPLTNEP